MTLVLAGWAVLLAKMVVLLALVLAGAAYLVLVERKLLGRLQQRFGPNRVGPFGLLQPLADGVKALLKEDLVPQGADRFLFLVVPGLLPLAAILAFAVVPFGSDLTFMGQKVPLVLADLDVGLLFALSLSSVGVYALALGGWASNSKYSLLGAVRGIGQMISYELPLGLSLVPIVMLAGTMSLTGIVAAQADLPFIVLQPAAFALFFISALAEIKRVPFDLAEAENELQAGFHMEYSGMRFALFFLGEYVNMIFLGALAAVFFLGGWHGPWLPPMAWMLLKTAVMPVLLIWIRATLPRLRPDQLMRLCWVWLAPLALLNIVATGAIMLLRG
ncbi:NADH-quinone oxidoreductase subunit H [Fundidesulfovibrio magnetotacticus]|uniref:NADH-quinone oxidoreductase subunit H n=1 Tax=Fundidesulfovibrio magnetotacticus TaxID=2730080 RepID=A0A6V8LN61_9BACT|nr:NADH-quinone oxidoreductase subunit NuoH [Fundidesulfovibrio magnetotacticus]GFK92450.1 NADH-quinone oxidoreductase subunit H [Fundidesulfovibrio magnetotacticus]